MSNVVDMPSASQELVAVDGTDAAANRPEPRISKAIRQVVDLLVSGECKTQKAACERVGRHPDYVCRELKKPQVRVLIERRARETVANGTMRASARLVELLDAGSEHVSLDASKHMLSIAGIKPSADSTQVSVNIELKAGYVIDLREDALSASDKLSEATRAKPLIIQGELK